MIRATTFSGIPILQFDLLLNCPELHHAIFLRETPFEAIEGLVTTPVCKLEQVHSPWVYRAPASAPGDGLYTTQKECALLIKHADCQAAIFYDPVSQTLACVHAGWRGLVQNIYTATIQKLKGKGVNPRNLLVAIGPSLGPKNGEFKGWASYFPPHFGAYQVKENYFDLRAVAKDELISQGVLPHHIAIAPHCTVEEPALFHSWRRDKTHERNGTIAWIKTF